MQEKLNIAVFVDNDNIEIGVKSTLRREFDVSLPLDALKERGDLVAKFAYANWGRQEGATRQMAENAVQMVQRLPSPRGDKNGADINLALDALEMAFTHTRWNAFAIVSGDGDLTPLVQWLKEYGKTVRSLVKRHTARYCSRTATSSSATNRCYRTLPGRCRRADASRVQDPASTREQRPPRMNRAEKAGPRQRPDPLDLGASHAAGGARSLRCWNS